MTDENTIDHYRLFVAITVPDIVREAVLRVQRELQALAPSPLIRWAKPEQFHLTLRFLGDVPTDRIGALEKSLRAACAGVAPLHLRAQGVGFFPNARRPRVIWVGIHDREDSLSIFQKRVEVAVQPYTMEQREDRFAGHITLGRIKLHNRFNVRLLRNNFESIETRFFGEWTAGEIEIFRSELLPAGSRYASLAACPLGTTIEPD